MLSLIVAYDSNRGIGKGNLLPWHLPNDLQHFKQITTGKTVIMGRSTFESIGKPLPNRKNIVLTRQKDYPLVGVETVTDLASLQSFKDSPYEHFIIGGADIFNQTIHLADKVYITYIDEVFEADTFFPSFDMSEWNLVSEKQGVKDKKNPYTYTFKVYERNSQEGLTMTTDFPCWFCAKKAGVMLFDTEFDTPLHESCLRDTLEKEPDHPEAKHMKYLIED